MNRAVRILRREEVFHRFIFRIDEVRLQYERFDGSMSQPLTRLVLNRGDSVAVLLHDARSDQVLLCEQFRLPTYEHGPGWLLELPAGMLEPDESPEACVRRESLEETGYSVQALDRIACVYLSPGGSSERIHLFYSQVSMSDRTGAGGGVIAENEDIRLISVPRGDAAAMARNGQIVDAKTLIALQWLELKHKP